MVKYIAFEGIDRSGKSTQIGLLQTWLSSRNYTSIVIFEPTFGQYGREIRKHIAASTHLSTARQIELFTKDRQEHVKTKVQPLLRFVHDHDSFIVIQDRCYLSAPAYQAIGEEAMLSLLEEQEELAPPPDIIFVIDVTVEEALGRHCRSGTQATLFERKDILERARNNYLFLAKRCNEIVRIIDGRGTSGQINQRITGILEKELA